MLLQRGSVERVLEAMGFYCDQCQQTIPENFQQEHIVEDDEHFHLHVGIRRIQRGSPEWRERVVPALIEQLGKLKEC